MKAKQLSRMDRIEKNLELLTQSNAELREYQKETFKQIRKSQKETDKYIKETDKQIRESKVETDKQIRESKIETDKQIRESKIETDKYIQETYKRLELLVEKTQKQVDKAARKVDAVGKQLGDMGIVQGEIGEDLFYRNVKCLFRKRGIEFETVTRNLMKREIAEYDIVAENRGQVLVIEVKNKLSKRMIDKFINKKLPGFKTVFPEYKDYRVSGGIGALVMKDDVSAYAEKKGLYVLTQRGDGGAMLTNREDFKPIVFD